MRHNAPALTYNSGRKARDSLGPLIRKPLIFLAVSLIPISHTGREEEDTTLVLLPGRCSAAIGKARVPVSPATSRKA